MLDHISTLQYSGLVSQKTKTYKVAVAGGRLARKLKKQRFVLAKRVQSGQSIATDDKRQKVIFMGGFIVLAAKFFKLKGAIKCHKNIKENVKELLEKRTNK